MKTFGPPLKKVELTLFCLKTFVSSYAFRHVLIRWNDGIMGCLVAITTNHVIINKCE